MSGELRADRQAWVYLLRCADGSLYTGWTTDVQKRLAAHNGKKGAKYTRSRLPVTLVYAEQAPDETAARRREYEIKRMTHQQKEMLIQAQEREETT